jgi:hypothetical protein
VFADDLPTHTTTIRSTDARRVAISATHSAAFERNSDSV